MQNNELSFGSARQHYNSEH